jgi:hypothetical protein
MSSPHPLVSVVIPAYNCAWNAGSYDGVWLAGIAPALLAAAMHWPIQERSHLASLKAA